jgi:hypothetical protein
MGDLWGSAAERNIELVLTTTNLSQQLPHQFPFLERSFGFLYFKPDDLTRVLPRDVVRWMIVAASQPNTEVGKFGFAVETVAKALGLLRLPAAADLPVLFGVRLSLSFPGLISAVRLYGQGEGISEGLSNSNIGDDQSFFASKLQPCWFSDGGITSNFPINAFDTALPTRPTFCIDLRAATPEDEKHAEKYSNICAAPGISADPFVIMPTRFPEQMAPRFQTRIDGSLTGFISAIISTARNGVENELMLMPGYRDRIAHILTRKGEGGLNLNMPEGKIKKLSNRGRHAAELLVSRFHPAGNAAQAGVMLTWATQRWIRYRSTMAGLERFLSELKQGWDARSDGAPTYDELNRRDMEYYSWLDSRTGDAARRCTEKILDVAAVLWSKAELLGAMPDSSVFDGIVQNNSEQNAHHAPRPKLGLFLRPVGSDPDRLRTYPASAVPGQTEALPASGAAEK